jgi:predicted dehydrogenase
VLKAEIESFLEAVAGRRQPVVTGEDGRRALETAIRINKKL